MPSPEQRRGAERTQAEERIWRESLSAIEELIRTTDLASRRLPIEEKIDDVAVALEAYGAISVEASPGAGKSLDLGKAVMDFVAGGNVAMTQPRRDAAEGVCLAAAARHGLKFGKDICFSTSEFHGNKRDTALQIQTTGILLNQFRNDPMLERYDAVIVDEAHERGLDIDLTLGLLKRANQLRQTAKKPRLKIIVASATLEQTKFATFFDIPAEARIQSKGRMFPVEKGYADEEEKYYKDRESGEQRERPYTNLAVNAINNILRRTNRGDVLVFMPGKREIEAVKSGLEQALGSQGARNIEIVTLHGENTQAQRSYVLKGKVNGDTRRRIIISTNIAETSVTVPDIAYVVDSCRKKEIVFDPKTGLEVLTEVPASKAECEQRAGRAGRLAKGEAIRLVTEAEFAELPDHPEPEIKRLDLTHMALRMVSLGIKDIETFEFVDPPPVENLKEAVHRLQMLGAITADMELTKIGKKMAELPLEPRLARVVVEAERLGCVKSAMAVASIIETRGVFRYPGREEYRAAEQKLLADKERTARVRALGRLGPYPSDPHQKTECVEQVVLRMLETGHTKITDYDFSYGVYDADIKSAIAILQGKSLVAQDLTLTAQGRVAARLPLRVPGADRLASEPREKFEIRDDEVKQEARRALAKRQEKLKAGLTSDWQLYYEIFRKFMGAPNRASFCQEHGLEMDALEQSLKNYYRLLKELRGFIPEEGEKVDAEALSMAILTGYAPDHLIMQTGYRRGVEFVRIDRGDASVRINSTSLAYEQRPRLAVCLSIEPGRGIKTERRGGRAETQFNYAVGVHPVGSEVLLKAIPHLVQRDKEGGEYTLDEKGNIQTTYRYQFKNKNGSWVRLPPDRLHEYSEGAVMALGRAIAEQSSETVKDEIFNVTENRETAEALKELYKRSRGQIPWKDLAAWYASRLGESISVEAAKILGQEHYRLTVREFCSPDRLKNIERDSPKRIRIGNTEWAVAYDFSLSRWERKPDGTPKENFVATAAIEFPGRAEAYRDLMKLRDADMGQAREQISSLQADDKLRLKIHCPPHYDYAGETLAELQKKLEASYLEEAFSVFSIKTPPRVLALDAIQPLPDPAAEAGPLRYAELHDGSAVFAHPGIHREQQYESGRGYVNVYSIRYYKTEDEAKEAYQEAQRVRDRETADLRRKQDRETMLEPAKARREKLRPILEEIFANYEALGLDYRVYDSLRDEWSAANRELDSTEGDVRAGLEKIGELEQRANELTAEKESRIRRVAEMQPRIDGLATRVEQVNAENYMAIGLTHDEYHDLRDTWRAAKDALVVQSGSGRERLPDPERAEKLLREVEGLLEARNRTPEQKALKQILTGRDARFIRLVRVEGRRVRESASALSPEERETDPGEIPIGTSGRVLQVRGNKLTFVYASGNTGASFTLPDGLYAISRDAGSVIRVERTSETGGQELTGLEIVYPDPYEETPAYGYGERTAAANPFTAASSGFSLGDRLQGALAGKGGKGRSKPAGARTEQAAAVPPREAEAPKETMTEELRTRLQSDATMARDVFEVLRSSLPSLKGIDKPTDLQKKQVKLRDKVADALRDLKDIDTELATTENAGRMKGLVGDISRRADRLGQEGARLSGEQENWPERYRKMRELIPSLEEEWGGKLSAEGRKRIAPRLIAIAKQPGDIEALRDRIGVIVAEELG